MIMNSILQKELELIHYVRHSVLTLTGDMSVAQMNQVPGKMKNNLIWNLGHMVFTQQMLCYQLGGLAPAIDLACFSEFAPDTVPERNIGAAEIGRIKTVFMNAFEQLATDIEANKLNAYTPWTLPSGIVINTISDAMVTNAIHEGRHWGVMISLAKAVS